MSDLQKYLKYKQKYINYKRQLGGFAMWNTSSGQYLTWEDTKKENDLWVQINKEHKEDMKLKAEQKAKALEVEKAISETKRRKAICYAKTFVCKHINWKREKCAIKEPHEHCKECIEEILDEDGYCWICNPECKYCESREKEHSHCDNPSCNNAVCDNAGYCTLCGYSKYDTGSDYDDEEEV